MLDSIPMGSHYFEIAVILRSSLLTSSMLCNSESWYNITTAEMKLLETVDVNLLRKILKAPKSTPTEMLYLELGCIPYADLIQKRRLMFLHYIMNQDPKSMIYHFFEVQRKNPTSKDWVSTVKKDIEELQLDFEFEDLKSIKKKDFKNILTKKIETNALEKLEQKKKLHSKVNHIQHGVLKMQTYLKPTRTNISKEERQNIFKLRSRVTEVKMNYKRKYEDLTCTACKVKEETQEHILECEEIEKKEPSLKTKLDFETIYRGSTEDKAHIARIFEQKMRIMKKFID